MTKTNRSTKDMQPGGSASWLLTVYEKAVKGIRIHSLPKKEDGVLQIKTPSLLEQAYVMRRKQGPSNSG